MKHFFNDALTIYQNQAVDEYGRETWGVGIPVNGRFSEENKVLFNAKGETITSDASIHVPAETEIDNGSRVVFDSQDYRVIKTKKPKDMSEVRFIKCYLEKYAA
jgi:head-tail adaptor